MPELSPACERWADRAELELATLDILAHRADARGSWRRLAALYRECPEQYQTTAHEEVHAVPTLLLANHWDLLGELGPLAEQDPDWLDLVLGALARGFDPSLPRRAAANAAACAASNPLCARIERAGREGAATVEARLRAVGVEARRRFAVQVRAVIERGDVEGFIALLSPAGLVCGTDAVPTAEVAEALRLRDGVYALLFDTRALRTSVRSRLPLYSFREFFQLARDAVPTTPPETNVIRWSSAHLGEVAEPPYLGVTQAGSALRVVLIGQGCR